TYRFGSTLDSCELGWNRGLEQSLMDGHSSLASATDLRVRMLCCPTVASFMSSEPHVARKSVHREVLSEKTDLSCN
ncbi:unnamed protein product, partial [Nesidiocoris tenuis]